MIITERYYKHGLQKATSKLIRLEKILTVSQTLEFLRLRDIRLLTSSYSHCPVLYLQLFSSANFRVVCLLYSF